jgi:nucleotide-binding universal stress UspA family protein
MDDKGPRRILLGYDGSDGSEKAVAVAVTLAKKSDATIVVCHAFGQMPADSKPSEVRHLVDPLVARLAKLGLTTQVALLDALPAQAILSAAAEHHADLIVLGAKGRGTFPNLLLGSTAERVLRHAKLPVLIAR